MNARVAFTGLVLAASAVSAQASGGDTLIKYWINPSTADPSIKRFDYPQYVVFERHVKSSAPLLVFLPGTDGRPANTTDFSNAAARLGYRVIGLSYNDVPAVAQVCPRDPDPRCSDKVREKRIFGDDVTRLIDDKKEESIVNRLVKLLGALQREHPGDGWSDYLDNEKPKWSRIAVSGLSQGAGMAAFIAQKNEVARVVLFSSPWDNYGRERTLAPWVRSGPGATPSDRWFAAYHQSEPMASVVARAYSALKIPPDHIRVFTLEPAKANAKGDIPYHPSGVGNGATPRSPDGTPAYLDDWRFMLGEQSKPSESAECYGFSFGKWTPPLDWELSGHGAILDSARVPRAPNGRGWAASDIEMPSDTSLLLFPPWWPAGVLVVFKTKPARPGDTVSGKALAFVADARKQPSTASIRGWLVPCQE